MDQCLSHAVIERYIRQLCSATEAASVEAHAAGCKACRQQIEEARPDGADGPRASHDRENIADRSTQPVPPGYGTPPSPSMPRPSEDRTEQDDRRSGPEILFENYQKIDELAEGNRSEPGSETAESGADLTSACPSSTRRGNAG